MLTVPSNYLQSPYFFMACNLCDADLNRPGQLAAALQGEDIDNSSQSALAGTLVSSLHRLKDVDNTGMCTSALLLSYWLIRRQMVAFSSSQMSPFGLRANFACALVFLKCSSQSDSIRFKETYSRLTGDTGPPRK